MKQYNWDTGYAFSHEQCECVVSSQFFLKEVDCTVDMALFVFGLVDYDTAHWNYWLVVAVVDVFSFMNIFNVSFQITLSCI